MTNKIALAITFFIAAIFCFVVGPIKAQTFDSDKAYQDYQYQLGVYQNAYSSFQDARDFYLKNQTLTLKEDARKKTLVMLKSRDQLISTYLTALRIKIVEVPGLSNDDKGSIYSKIDPEVKWYQDHQGSYQDGDSLDTLFSKNGGSQDRYANTSLPIIYETLFDISLGQELGIEKDQQTVYSDLKDIINTGVAAGKLDINPFNRWFTDIDNVVNDINNNSSLAKTQIQGLYSQTYVSYGAYGTASETLSKSQNSLSQLNNNLIEVLTSIRNQQK